jgi:hypothetical protein
MNVSAESVAPAPHTQPLKARGTPSGAHLQGEVGHPPPAPHPPPPRPPPTSRPISATPVAIELRKMMPTSCG